MSEEYGRMRTRPPCRRQGVSGQEQRVLVIARVLPPEASSRRWKRLGKVGVREQLPFSGAR